MRPWSDDLGWVFDLEAGVPDSGPAAGTIWREVVAESIDPYADLDADAGANDFTGAEADDYAYEGGYAGGFHFGYGFGGYGYPSASVAKAFVKEAHRYVDRVDEAAKSVPFWTYQAGYRDMTEAQLRWYFSWRDRVRSGRFPSTDAGYVHLLAYELINGVGVEGPEDGFAKLTALERAYSAKYYLGYFFHRWTEDYALVHGLTEQFVAVRQAHGLAENGPHFPNFAIQVRAEGPIVDMPLAMIGQVAQVPIEASKFYLAGNQKLMAHVVPRAMDAIDVALRGGGTRGIFARYAPRAPRPETRKAFEHALYGGRPVKVELPRAPEYANGTRLIKLTKGIVKHTENRLRATTGFKSRLHSFVIEPEHAAIIDDLVAAELPTLARASGGTKGFAALPAPVVVTIDPHRVGRLRHESDEVRGMLIEAMAGESELPTAPVVEPPVAQPAAIPSAGDEPLALSDAQRAALAILLDGGDVAGEVRRVAVAAGVMPEVLLDEINEAALALIGDAIVDLSGPQPALYEEYAGQVAAMVGR